MNKQKSNSKISFNEKCYEILKKVPKGKVITYKQIAQNMRSKAYRAVGNAMNKNTQSYLDKGNIPCHRVINSNGNIGGFNSGVSKKKKLLENEGVEIINNKINLEKFGFDLK